MLIGCLIALCSVAVSGCDTSPADIETPEPGVIEATTQGPAGAHPGSCWGRTVSPAVIETVTEQVQVQPAQISSTGEVQAFPIYRTETRQQIVKPRIDNWFETPCAVQMTPQFVETLQRALEARGIYTGPISGSYDAPTRAAMRNYQISAGGPDSPILALTTARQLGLIAVDRATLE
ncbi:peptidoglycan-binding protein [Sulfitobacter sp. CW3]|uniref:peptidoglycan-binding domain-containing protein n=1 Tax=Sulfitobacter sp. CW3 TaxID=2861965 RepID=UPI0027E4DE6A|nr:peptidoglycan-binding protein [Sulfitobacter sp. CW3]